MFIVIEGGDGIGKSTLTKGLIETLSSRGRDIEASSDLAGTRLGAAIKGVFLSESIESGVDSAMLMMTAARLENIHERIIPALKMGKWVISDRFVDSTYAYQVKGQGGNADIFTYACDMPLGVQPDVVLILDADPSVGIGRAIKRGALDKMERKSLEFFNRVREGFIERSTLPGRIIIDATQSPEAVLSQALSIIESHEQNLKTKKKKHLSEDLSLSHG